MTLEQPAPSSRSRWGLLLAVALVVGAIAWLAFSGIGSALVYYRTPTELRALGAAKGDAYRAGRRGRRADGVACGHAGGRVDVLTEDYLTVYLGSDRWDGTPRLDVTID